MQYELFDKTECGPAQREDNVFFALLPDNGTAEIALRLVTLAAGEAAARRSLAAGGRLHLSVFGVRDRISDRRALLAGNDIAADLPDEPLRVVFDHMALFQGGQKKPLVLYGKDIGNPGLIEFRRRFCIAAANAGLGLARHQFEPHVTLLWTPTPMVEHRVETISWEVRDFALVRSFVGHSRHEQLGRWPLGGRRG